jgi:uncharacterized membrane protein
MTLLLTGIFCSPAGVIGGKLFDIYGNYRLAFEINMMIAGIGIVALLFASRPQAPRNVAERTFVLDGAS